jgi:hypothetical protein
MVPKLIGPEVVRGTTIYRTSSTKICAYRYKVEFHAHLSRFRIYWSLPYILDQRKQSMPYNIHLVNMHAQDFQEPKEIQFGQNTKKTKKSHKGVKN